MSAFDVAVVFCISFVSAFGLSLYRILHTVLVIPSAAKESKTVER